MTTKERLPWFKCFPSKWLGALAAMKQDEGYVYIVVCFRIYEIGGPCTDTLDALAIRTHLNKRRVSDLLDRLFRSGKLVRDGEGIMNPFAANLLSGRKAIIAERVDAGQKGASARWEKDEQNQTTEDGNCHFSGKQSDGDLELDLEPEKEEHKVVIRFSRPTRFPEKWIAPDQAAYIFGRKKGWTDSIIEDQFQKFKLHHTAKGSKWERWDLVWCQWVTNEIKWAAERAARNGNRQPQNGKRSFAEIARGTDDHRTIDSN